MKEKGERVWLPGADWLIAAATFFSLAFVIVPIVSFSSIRFPAAVCGSVAALAAGYLPAILAHYRILFGMERTGPRHNPEPMERLFIVVTAIIAVGLFVARYFFGSANWF